MIKKCYIALICSIFYSNFVFAETECGQKANTISNTYFQQNKTKQISNFDNLSAAKQKEAKIRNLCFGASIDWHFFCEYAKCRNIPKTEKIDTGISISQMCSWADMDCFSSDIEKVFSVMQDSHDALFGLTYDDMDTINNSIIKKEQTMFQVDFDFSRCYKTDSNDDTVWHAFARSKQNLDWSSICASYLRDTHLKELSESMYKTKNKNGKTALQETIEWNKNTNLLQSISEIYGEKGGRKACDELAYDISTTNSIDISQAKSLIHRCYIFADRK